MPLDNDLTDARANVQQPGTCALPDDFRLSVVIPVYNEVRTLEEIVSRVRQCGVPVEMILVDDGSTDGSRELLASWSGASDMQVIFHEQNRGKGAALKTGLLAATGDAVIIQDADLEYDPADYLALLEPIVAGRADVVFGSRFLGDKRQVSSFRHRLGNRLLTMLSNATTRLNLTDMETCYKVFRREVVQQLAPRLQEARFGIEPELTARVAALPAVRIDERPISYRGRTLAEGKKITWRDGLWAVWCIVKYARVR